MEKNAQKRSILNRLREVTNVGGIAAEKLFNPEFQEIMDRLRESTDDPVRAIVSGEQIGNASPPDDAISLKDLLKSSKSNLNRREYMKAIADLGRFHKKLYDVVKILSSFSANLDKIHEKFLFEGLDEDSKKYLHDLKSRVASKKNILTKEAGILDFFNNIGTERGRALAAWEKRYPKDVKKLKKASARLLEVSQSTLNFVLNVLKELAKYRATRDVDNYIAGSKKIIEKYNSYDTIFREFYKDHVKNFLEKQELVAPTKVDVSTKPEDISKQDVEVAPITEPGSHFAPAPGSMPMSSVPSPASFQVSAPGSHISPAPGSQPVSTKSTPTPSFDSEPVKTPAFNMPEGNIPRSKQPTKVPSGALPSKSNVPDAVREMYQQVKTPGTLKGLQPAIVPLIHAPDAPSNIGTAPTLPSPGAAPYPTPVPSSEFYHPDFLKSVNSMANESPLVLAAYINKYAKMIEATDSQTANKLYNIVKLIKG